MSDELHPNANNLHSVLKQLDDLQLRFVSARIGCKTDKEACDRIGIHKATPYRWDNKALVDQAVKLLLTDGVILSAEILRRNAVKAAQVKVAGLDSKREATRQAVAGSNCSRSRS